MAYVAVKGGERAIDNAHAWLAETRRGDRSVPELSLAQIAEQLGRAVDRVMGEGSLYDRELAALAIKQAQGDLIEAAFLLRAYRTTLPRFAHSLPVDTAAPAGKPASYLSLYQASAARYCPGLSWTVLAAIGQIESGDGANMGPSSAGALGPMQFLPSTWKTWGITAFGQASPPNIMNPFDAVPSAARMLCADGAGSSGSGLRQAIFDYNHATWYVDEVLTLAGEYAAEFG